MIKLSAGAVWVTTLRVQKQSVYFLFMSFSLCFLLPLSRSLQRCEDPCVAALCVNFLSVLFSYSLLFPCSRSLFITFFFPDAPPPSIVLINVTSCINVLVPHAILMAAPPFSCLFRITACRPDCAVRSYSSTHFGAKRRGDGKRWTMHVLYRMIHYTVTAKNFTVSQLCVCVCDN